MFTVRPESFFFPKKTLVRLYSIIILVTGKDFFFRGDPFFLFVSDERAKGAAFRFGPAVLVDRSSVESAQIECLLFFSLVETCGFFFPSSQTLDSIHHRETKRTKCHPILPN